MGFNPFAQALAMRQQAVAQGRGDPYMSAGLPPGAGGQQQVLSAMQQSFSNLPPDIAQLALAIAMKLMGEGMNPYMAQEVAAKQAQQAAAQQQQQMQYADMQQQQPPMPAGPEQVMGGM